MAKRKTDEVTASEDTDLMAVVEATEPVAAPEAQAEPKPEPVFEAPLSPPPAATGRSGFRSFAGLVLGGILAAGLGFGLARFVPDLLPSGPDSNLAATVQAQGEEIATLREALAALPDKPAPDPALEARLAALESASQPDIASLESRLSEMEARLATPAEGSVPASVIAELAALKDQVARIGAGGTVPADVTAAAEAAEARLKEAEARATALAEEAEAAAAASRRAAALDRIAAALDSGAPYAAALRDLGGDLPLALADHAQTGLPTLADLHEAFAPAARESLEAALRANMGESWTDRVSSFLRSQTGLRSLTPREGDDPDAVLSRAEAALAAGDVAVAIAELEAMPDAGRAALEEWLVAARQRVEAQSAFAALAAN